MVKLKLVDYIKKLFGSDHSMAQHGGKIKDFVEFDEGIRLYVLHDSYSVVWKGKINLDSFLAAESNLFDEYLKLSPPNKDTSPVKEINYLTENEHFERYLEPNAISSLEHKIFLNKYDKDIIFARIDNPLFGITADFYDKVQDDRCEIGVNLKGDFIDSFFELYESTNFEGNILDERRREYIVITIAQKRN